MKRRKCLKGMHRKQLLDELYNRYANTSSLRIKLRYWRKKYLWLLLVGGTRFLKRFIDISFSILLLITLSPFLLLISLIIKLKDGGSILYLSKRVGKWGKEFIFPKFRTMIPNADRLKEELQEQNKFEDDIKFKISDDPRITKFGKLLRKTSLDELPQLWTVLKGDMTLVGPRPPLPEEVALYTLEQRRRLDVKPGLTCFWQVEGRSDIPFEKQVELDIAYIESQSLLLDLKLILKTIPAILFGKGAY